MRTILLVAANPLETSRLRLDKEFNFIAHIQKEAKTRDSFRIVKIVAATDDDLREALCEEKPEIVHFSGHGTGPDSNGAARDIGVANSTGPGGLAFEDEAGHLLPVSGESLAGLFKNFKKHLRCVVLNACFSEGHADAIARHIDFAVGMKRAIEDKAAICFARGFYDAIIRGDETVECAFDLGCSAIQTKGLSDYEIPVLKKNVSVSMAPIASILSVAQPSGPASTTRSTPARFSAPPPPATPAASPALDPIAVRKAGRALAEYEGQFAYEIARLVALEARTIGHLYDLLSKRINDPDSRARFLRARPT